MGTGIARCRGYLLAVGLRPEQIEEAQAAQHAAAHDESGHVRVVAGPGTGKSATIEERVCWLLEQSVDADHIAAVSFTRAAARDLEARIDRALAKRGFEGRKVAVSTLHSLALRALKAAGALTAYPADPVVLQRWELREIFEAEFGESCGVGSIGRREQIRRDHEGYWCTGEFDPPNIIPPDPPITDAERDQFNKFHRPRTLLYSCVLPGEVVARCVDRMEAGVLKPAELLGVRHLIIDEFQDLNPMDLRFVHGMAEEGVSLFVAGDDDQSLYAFRFASPEGIERFTDVRHGCGDHTLSSCFRSTPKVLNAAQTLMRTYAAEGRIEKDLVSLWEEADPPVSGGLGAWSFKTGAAEAHAIAQSCAALVTAGMNPRDVMILLASTGQARELHEALADEGVPFALVREEDIKDTDAGRAGYALLSIVVEPMNYVAHRTLLGIRKGIGLRTCNDIARAVIAKHQNFRDLFYGPVPDGLLENRGVKAVAQAADVCAHLAEWSPEELLGDRIDDLCAWVNTIRCDESADDDLRAFLSELPGEMTLQEAHAFLTADRDDDRRRVLRALAARLGEEELDTMLVPDRVRVLTMHGAKGLSAQVVFIPGLEESILPGEKRRPYPGLVLEAARMLYVSITRARVVCCLSHARGRVVHGKWSKPAASQFTTALGCKFRPGPLNGIWAKVAEQTVEAARRMS